jgi:hypothetical protein
VIAIGKTRRSWAVAPALMTVVLILGTGCGSSGSQPPPPNSSTPSTPAAAPSSATTSQDPKTTAASKAAVTAYLGYVNAFAAASQLPDPDYPGLNRYLNQPLLSRTRHELRSMRDRGVVQVGAQTATVTSTTVDLTSAQPSVTIHACQDYSALRLVYKANHSPVPNSQIKTPKVPVIVTVWLFVNGQWMVTDAKDGTGPC